MCVYIYIYTHTHTHTRTHTHTHTHTHTYTYIYTYTYTNVYIYIYGIPQGLQAVAEESGALVEIHAEDPGVMDLLKASHAWAPPGLRWKEVGPAKPASGTEIKNAALAAALLEEREFAQAELERLVNGAGLSYQRYVFCHTNRSLLPYK